MKYLSLLLLSWKLLAPKTDEDRQFRIELAQAIVDADPTPHEARLLMSIARWESNYRRDVAECAVNGDANRSVTSFQIQARSAEERACICGSLVCAAKVAIKRVRESYGLCAHLPEPERLSAYVSGKCHGEKSKAMSRTRWVK